MQKMCWSHLRGYHHFEPLLIRVGRILWVSQCRKILLGAGYETICIYPYDTVNVGTQICFPSYPLVQFCKLCSVPCSMHAPHTTKYTNLFCRCILWNWGKCSPSLELEFIPSSPVVSVPLSVVEPRCLIGNKWGINIVVMVLSMSLGPVDTITWNI